MAKTAYPQMPEERLIDVCETWSVAYYPNHGHKIYQDVNTAAGTP